MHRGKFLAARHDEIDEPLEGGFFFGGVIRPALFVAQLSTGVPDRYTEKILKTGVTDEGIAFEIDEDIAIGGFGQFAEAGLFDDGQNRFVPRNLEILALDLDSSLFAHAVV